METFVFTCAVFLLAVGGLAVGVMAGRAPIKGSCGGLNCIKGARCGACGAAKRLEEG